MLKYIEDYEPSLEELQKLVGGYIEVHTLRNGDSLIMNEEGLMQNLPINQEATKLFMVMVVRHRYVVSLLMLKLD